VPREVAGEYCVHNARVGMGIGTARTRRRRGPCRSLMLVPVSLRLAIRSLASSRVSSIAELNIAAWPASTTAAMTRASTALMTRVAEEKKSLATLKLTARRRWRGTLKRMALRMRRVNRHGRWYVNVDHWMM
jgi:hypothetical protein